MAYANPVPGVLHPKGWSRPAGNVEFQITRDCADHRATNQGCAVDIWNGRCDGQVLASRAGRVVTVYPPEGIVRIDHGDGDISGYAHMFPILVSFGQNVAAGQQIGEVSDAHSASIPNFSGCHLHFAIERNGVEIDPLPLLTGDDMTIIVNATMFLGADGKPAPRSVGFDAGVAITGYALDGSSEQFTAGLGGSSAPADAMCAISGRPDAPVGQPFVRITKGVFEDHPYLLATQPGLNVAPDPKPAATTAPAPADCGEAVRQAVATRDGEWETKLKTTLHP